MKYDQFSKPDRRLIAITTPASDIDGEYYPSNRLNLWMILEKRSDGEEWGQLFRSEGAAKQKMEDYSKVPDEYTGGGYIDEPEDD